MRFLVLAYPLLILLLAAFGFLVDHLQPDPGGLWPASTPIQGRGVVAAWALEALALLALFLLLEGRFRSRVWEGLATAWIAWVFRGPLLVVSVAAAGLPHRPWWRLSLAWWVLYTVAGLSLASLATSRRAVVEDEDEDGPSGRGARLATDAGVDDAPARDLQARDPDASPEASDASATSGSSDRALPP